MQEIGYIGKVACNFRLIGIKMERCLSKDEQIRAIVRSMQKSLYGAENWFYFYDGFDIDKNKQTCHVSSTAFDDTILYNVSQQTISISAIVGKNGTGKSTIIDMLIRVLNNLSAALLGEEEIFPAAEHLHYIDNVYASVAAFCDGIIYVIEVKGRKLNVYPLYSDEDNLYSYREGTVINILSPNQYNSQTPIQPQNFDKQKQLERLFYTTLYNYSLYAYNYRDYLLEKTPIERIKKISRAENKTNDDDLSWFKGVFHKNDGYQTPLVLNPMRYDGRLDSVKENSLAKERLLNLLYYHDREGTYPFRSINDKLQIVGLNLSRSRGDYNPSFVIEKLGLEYSTLDKNYSYYYDIIINIWAELFDFKYQLQFGWEQETCNYIVYKTIKIAKQYHKYSLLWVALSIGGDDVKETITKYINDMAEDESHVTLKLRRALRFMSNIPVNGKCMLGHFSLNEYYDEVIHRGQGYSIEIDEEKELNYIASADEFLPPPTIAFDFDIVPISCIAPNGTYKQRDVIPFEGLSAGERQITYSISNFMYHLVNIESVWRDRCQQLDHNVIRYRNVNVIFDELELYFHPDLQRKFVNMLLKSLESGDFISIKGINILLVTHSPFVLSDLPRTNILALGDRTSNGETFCANIHEMLGHSFFMPYSIGELAQKNLECLFKVYNKFRTEQDKSNFVQTINLKRYSYIASKVADSYLSKTTKRIVEEIASYNIDEELKTAQERVKRLLAMKKRRQEND